jgi:hypothetical protein
MTRSDELASTFSARLTGRIRWIAVRGLAAASAGVIVLGLGGRLAMFLSRLLHPDSVGRFTENGNQIGDFTVAGTLGLLLFGGLAGGLFAGVVWVIVKKWISDNPLLVGLGTVAIGGFLLIEADNRDFTILDPPAVDVTLLLALVFAFGVVMHRLDVVFDRRLPTGRRGLWALVYALMAAVGVLLAIPTFGNFFSTNFCACAEPPIWTGILLIVTSVATLCWWVLGLRGAVAPPDNLRLVGRIGTAGAAVAGAIHLVGQIAAIV